MSNMDEGTCNAASLGGCLLGSLCSYLCLGLGDLQGALAKHLKEVCRGAEGGVVVKGGINGRHCSPLALLFMVLN